MCTRKFAIETINTEKSGTKKELIGKIGHFYDAFIIMGLIREKISIDRNGLSGSDRVQWEKTDRATKYADLFVSKN